MKDWIEKYDAHTNDPVNIEDLADIQDVEIDLSLPVEEKRKSYLRQIRNPRLYRCGDVIVRASFARTNATLEDRLKQYLLSVQGLAI